LIRLRNVSFAFPGARARDVLARVNLDVRDGEWVAVAGGNGSGKTTLCRIMAGILTPREGTVEIDGFGSTRLPGESRGVSPTGIAFQNPDSQFVTSSVERELLFGMENLGFGADLMRSRREAAVRAFVLEPFLTRNPHTLSGGEKQRLLLACLWAMGPQHLILDEPLSFLDAVGGAAFLGSLRGSFQREGKTIVWSTVDAEEAALADRVIYLAGGEIRFDGPPGDLARSVPAEELQASLVSGAADHVPVDATPLREDRGPDESPRRKGPVREAAVVEVKDARFSPSGGRFVLEVPFLSIASGERVGICGPSGSGKTTLLLACGGLLPPGRGTVMLLGAPVRSRHDFPAGRVAFIFQSPEEGFFAPTVREEVSLARRNLAGGEESGAAVSRALAEAGLSPEAFLARNPFRLSQGEKRLVALASVLVLEASLYLLDEPTIFLDGGARRRLRSALERLSARGATVVVASHDAAFLRGCTDRIVTLDHGRLA
jgi:energy-coupling factor transporter ATP-binding protein EcfA2